MSKSNKKTPHKHINATIRNGNSYNLTRDIKLRVYL